MRFLILYAEPNLTIDDIRRELEKITTGDIHLDGKDLTIQPPNRPEDVWSWPYVQIYPVGLEGEAPEDLARVDIPEPAIFHARFDNFRLLEHVILALADAYRLWIAHSDLDPTPGDQVAARIRSEPAWHLGHPSTLPD